MANPNKYTELARSITAEQFTEEQTYIDFFAECKTSVEQEVAIKALKERAKANSAAEWCEAFCKELKEKWDKDDKARKADKAKAKKRYEPVEAEKYGDFEINFPFEYNSETGNIWITTDKAPVRVFNKPVIVTKKFEDIDSGDVLCEIEFSNSVGRKIRKVVQEGEMGVARLVLEWATKHNFPVNDINKTYVVKYFSQFLHDNEKMLNENLVSGVTKLGFVTDKETGELAGFYPYSEHEYIGTQRKLVESVSAKGKYDKWLDCANVCEQDERLRMALLASCASPLLSVLNRSQGFVVQLFGQSGSGKTTALQFAASVWGNTRIGKLIYSADTTATGSEGYMGNMQNLPALFDDLESVAKKSNIDRTELVYRISNSMGRVRGTVTLEAREPKTWCLIGITTGEYSIYNAGDKKGVLNRVIDVDFEERKIFGGENASATTDSFLQQAEENRGHLGKKIVDYILDKGKDELMDEYSDFFRKFEVAIKHGETKYSDSGRQIASLGILAFAEKMLGEIGTLKSRLTIEQWRAYVKTNEEVNVVEVAVSGWKEHLIENIGKFSPNPVKVCGNHKLQGGYHIFYVLPKFVEEYCLTNHITKQQFTKRCLEEKTLIKGTQGYLRMVRLKLGYSDDENEKSMPTSCYEFRFKVNEQEGKLVDVPF